MPTGTADLAALARDRSERAGLLGRLLVTEPGPAEATAAQRDPALAAAFADLDAARSDFVRLLLGAVPCHESVFTSADAEMGRLDPELLAAYDRWDFAWEGRWRVAAPDHLGVQLLFFAHLCAVEGQAWADDRPDAAVRAVEAERELLTRHAGVWGPVAADALERAAGGTAYGAVAAAVRDLLAGECDRLRPAPDHAGLPPVEAGLPPEAGAGGGPARIARRLLAPDRAGGFLTAADVAPLAAAVGAPWRPSDTRARLRQVVEAAADAGRLAALTAALVPTVEGWARRWAAERDRQPGAWRIFEGWRLRAAATAAWLQRLDAGQAPATPVLHVGDQARLARAVAELSAAGFVVTVQPAPADAVERADVAVTLDPDGPERWVPAPPAGWDRSGAPTAR